MIAPELNEYTFSIDPGAETEGLRRFFREFLAASAVCGLFLLWFFHRALPPGRSAFALTAAEALHNVPEPQYQTLSAYGAASRFLRRGIFPSWTPEAQGGTPLIGKMMPGVFSPFNLPYYLVSAGRLYSAAAMSAALKFYFAFIFLYLFARLLKLGWFGAVFAGVSFLSSQRFEAFILFGIPTSALCVPLLLLLAELYFHERRRLALFLLPWACAFSFFGGHFETAFLANLTAAVYFAARLWGEAGTPSREKGKRLLAFAGALLAGAGLCGFYLMAGQEYVRNSYTTVWRTLPSYGWHYHVIAKHLTWDDLSTAFWGLSAAGLSCWFLGRLPRVCREGSWRAQWGQAALTAALLSVAMAFLANLGLDLSFFWFGTHFQDGTLIFWAADLLLLFLAFWAWGTSESAPLRVLGWIMLAILLVRLKIPPLTNGMIHLPLFENFNNEDYHFAFNAAVGVLGGSAFDRLCVQFGQGRDERRRSAGSALVFVGVFLASAAGARALEGVVARNLSTGLNPLFHGAGQPSGGIMGPERARTSPRQRTLAGWTAGYQPPASVQVGLLENGQIVGGVNAAQEKDCVFGRCYFSAALPLPERPSPEFDVQVAARADDGHGRQQAYLGPVLTVLRRGQGRWGEAALAGMLALSVLIFGLNPVFLRLLYLAMILAWCWPLPVPASPAGAASELLPGVEKIKGDPGLFRVSGFNLDFMHADFLSLRGLSDFRTGGDNLDVFSMIEFSKLCYGFLADRRDPKATALGLRLLGLANVRYLLGSPQEDVEHPDLERVYQGPDMRVYRNRRAQPRAVFFDRQVFVPLKIKDLWDRQGEGRILGPIMGEIAQGRLDPSRTLLLHDLPSFGGGAPARASKSPAQVEVREYQPDRVLIDVDAPGPGFLFLGDNYFPGWRASVNGRTTPILRSWITFRAVEVPGGKSTVEFRYKPAFMGLPLLVSVLSCVAWLILFLRWRGGPGEPPAAAAAPKGKVAKKALLVPQTSPPSVEARACAQSAEVLCLGLIGAALLFWLAWGGFVYRGAFVNWTSRLLLAGGAVLIGLSRGGGRRT